MSDQSSPSTRLFYFLLDQEISVLVVSTEEIYGKERLVVVLYDGILEGEDAPGIVSKIPVEFEDFEVVVQYGGRIVIAESED